MVKTYKIGARTSPLALRQVEEVITLLKKFYPAFKVEVVGIETYGDRSKETPISEIEGTDFFTRDIDEALLNRDIDIAVHSAKDLPDKLREGLAFLALTPSIDPFDVLVSASGLKLDELSYRAKIGTSSARRKQGLKKFRDDFEIVDIRGNIKERLWKLDNSDLDAIVIASAGLIRLGLGNRITQRIPFEILQPHPLQGRLAIVVRGNDEGLEDLIKGLDR